MNKKPVLYIDSGIGGMPYCLDFIKNNPDENICYLADNKNFPYGPRGKDELISILISLTEKIQKKTEPKIIILACNTATIPALPSLRQRFPYVSFVGTVPAIKPASLASNNGRVGVLGTARTIEEIQNHESADNNCKIIGIAAPELVDFVEFHLDNSSSREKIKIVRKYISLFITENVDTLVLGCTHFLNLLDEFRSEAKSYFKVFDSISGITKRIEFLLDENNGALRVQKNSTPEYCLFITGSKKENSLWEKRAQKTGFKLLNFDEL
jgi:glutamate racemase